MLSYGRSIDHYPYNQYAYTYRLSHQIDVNRGADDLSLPSILGLNHMSGNDIAYETNSNYLSLSVAILFAERGPAPTRG